MCAPLIYGLWHVFGAENGGVSDRVSYGDPFFKGILRFGFFFWGPLFS